MGRVIRIGALFITFALVSISGFILFRCIGTLRSSNQNSEKGSLEDIRTESPIINADDASKTKTESLSTNRSQTLIGTWVKEKSMKEGGDYPGDKDWHLSVTFDDNGRFIWNSKRIGKDQAPVDESITGTYSIERGFLLTYKFDKPSSISQQRLPEYFAFWPSKLIGQQTFRFHNDYLILGHDGGKLWFMLKRNDNFGHVAQPDRGENPASG